MDAKRAADALRELKQLADSDPTVQAATPQHVAWRAKVQSVLDQTLGPPSHIAKQFRDLHYSIGVYSGRPGEAEEDARYFRGAVQEAAALIDAATYQLELDLGDAIDSEAFDPGLWDHVKHNVDEERWDQVASAAVIYVEDKVRRWAGNPPSKQGGRLTGKDLFLNALAVSGPLALGAQTNETEGWRNLGSGLVAAVGNVDRHTIQDREDGRRYAMGVVGLASLLLTQLRHQYPDAAR